VDTRVARAYLTLNEADPVRRAAYLGAVMRQLTMRAAAERGQWHDMTDVTEHTKALKADTQSPY